ncbi:RdgB/HAM1 family non-canonical purine NTP pyrophosphatase [Humidisolicoccus flavus]|uniref:RdgB/HAM1 family non-canonical purine NTP pyrophosphatase n=1 Tax=Humidisolicoccus flavus TaxID=3111414 RepID=UPI0032533209
MMQAVVATHSAHKVSELRAILGSVLPDLELRSYDGPSPVEDGATFEANALIKARAAFEHTGIAALADDSGISVAALDGAPGIYSARYSASGDDHDNLTLLLRNMEGVAARESVFVCAAAYVDAEGETVVRGEWPGELLTAARGEGGFGYDPIFKPEGFEVSAAELTREVKNAESHRARAFHAIAALLQARVADAADEA